MSKNKASTPGRIPEFTSLEEEAAFWDTHSTADYEEEFTPVRVRFAKRLSTGITIRLDPDTLKRLRTLAHQQGIGPTTLIRMWVLERLNQQEGASHPNREPARREG
jgi:predicted DNA binding CopG/RHH family protein